MWTVIRPDENALWMFRRRQQYRPFSYRDVGATDCRSPAGFDLDHHRIQLGYGEQTFTTACEALRLWQQFPPGWTQIYPARAPLEAGETVVMLARAFRLWWMNACRIVYVIDEMEPMRRFGFACGTLPGHAECGEERFTIERDEEDRVWYDLRAFSRPAYLPARILYRPARALQRQFVVDSQEAIRQYVADHAEAPSGSSLEP